MPPSASRAIVDPTTLTRPITVEPAALAARSASSVSAVSPDCEIADDRDFAVGRLPRLRNRDRQRFRYGRELRIPGTLTIAISQSGETANTLEALRAAKAAGSTVIGLVNVVGSTIAREADGGIYLHAGPEIGVASTKAFTAQVVALLLLGLWLGRQRGMSVDDGRAMVTELLGLPRS